MPLLFKIAIIFSLLLGCRQPTSNRPTQTFDIDWSKLTESNCEFKYIQLNFDDYPTKETVRLKITDFSDSDSLKLLSPAEVSLLQKLINDSENFSEGECGTFHLNGGIIIMKNGIVKGTIEMGCGFGQWGFHPENPNSKFGSFSDKGFEAATGLLDKINMASNSK